MRTITKNITLPLDGIDTDFRLTKLDAFSGVQLLHMLNKYVMPAQAARPDNKQTSAAQVTRPDNKQASATQAAYPAEKQTLAVQTARSDGKQTSAAHFSSAASPSAPSSVLGGFSELIPPDEFTSLMKLCLQHTEAMTEIGFQPVLDGELWRVPALRYDTLTCLRLTYEAVSWTLDGFFGASGKAAVKETQATCR